jgi:hypothetical protein
MSKAKTENKQTSTADTGGKGLDGQYRNIGISAVAAALPYAGKAKTPAHRDNDRRHSGHKRSVLAV